MSTFAKLLFVLLVHFAPPERFVDAHAWTGHVETSEERTARYEDIARDLETVLEDPKAVLFSGPSGKEKTAALVLAVAFHESGFAPDVDLGPCRRDKNPKRCDGGRATCMLQVHVLPDGKTQEGWTPDELQADRTKCFRAGLRAMRASFKMCARSPLEDRLAAYASGSCDRGLKGSRELWALYVSFRAAAIRERAKS
jgi:hypothetical protein